jgi:hypothetical protein
MLRSSFIGIDVNGEYCGYPLKFIDDVICLQNKYFDKLYPNSLPLPFVILSWDYDTLPFVKWPQADNIPLY